MTFIFISFLLTLKCLTINIIVAKLIAIFEGIVGDHRDVTGVENADDRFDLFWTIFG